jgi:GTP diphosphokinase / guanosine-3',5'-bis(diphosphate) 3'-diphosphatase
MKSELIQKAYYLSKEAHKKDKSIDGKPYFEHLKKTYLILKRITKDETILCAGLLHDVVEDTDYTIKEIKKEFGEKISFIVDSLTKIPGYSKNFNRTLEKVKKGIKGDRRVLLVKLADMNENIRVLKFVKKKEKDKVTAKTFRMLDVLEPFCKTRLEKRLLENKRRAIHKYLWRYSL